LHFFCNLCVFPLPLFCRSFVFSSFSFTFSPYFFVFLRCRIQYFVLPFPRHGFRIFSFASCTFWMYCAATQLTIVHFIEKLIKSFIVWFIILKPDHEDDII
jgi:hypothetical protein